MRVRVSEPLLTPASPNARPSPSNATRAEEDVRVRDRNLGDVRERPTQARRVERSSYGNHGPSDEVRDGWDGLDGHSRVLRALRAGKAGVPPRFHQAGHFGFAMRRVLQQQAHDRQGTSRRLGEKKLPPPALSENLTGRHTGFYHRRSDTSPSAITSAPICRTANAPRSRTGTQKSVSRSPSNARATRNVPEYPANAD